MATKNIITAIFSIIISLALLFRSIFLLIILLEPYWYKDLNLFWIIFAILNFLVYVYAFRTSIWLLKYQDKGRKGIVACSLVLLFFWLFLIINLLTGLYPKEIWLTPLDIIVPLFYISTIFYYTRKFVKKQFN